MRKNFSIGFDKIPQNRWIMCRLFLCARGKKRSFFFFCYLFLWDMKRWRKKKHWYWLISISWILHHQFSFFFFFNAMTYKKSNFWHPSFDGLLNYIRLTISRWIFTNNYFFYSLIFFSFYEKNCAKYSIQLIFNRKKERKLKMEKKEFFFLSSHDFRPKSKASSSQLTIIFNLFVWMQNWKAELF